MLHYKDHLDRNLYFPSVPLRIVSLVPSQTELLVSLGLEEMIVGVTKFCVHPDYLRSKVTVVGGTKQVRIEKIKSLNPDIILCNKEENTVEIAESLHPIAPVHVSDINRLEDAYALISDYGHIFNCKERADALNRKIQVEAFNFNHFLSGKKTFRVAYLIWKDPWMVAGGDTFINHLLELNGFENVFSNRLRYPEVTISELQEAGADFILLSSEPYPFKEDHISELTSHINFSKMILVDGEYFSWYGSRMVSAFEYFENLRKKLEVF